MATRQATSTAASAPNIEEAMYNGILVRVEEKLVKGGLYTKNTKDGDPKLEWTFNLRDSDGDIMVHAEEDANGDPNENAGKTIEVSKLTGTGFNIASKTTPQEVRMLKALCTKAEYTAFENGEGTPDDAVQAPEGLLGRGAQLEVFVKENGWPGVGNVVAPLGGQKGKDLSD